MPDNDSATIGYRWVCTRGKDGCEQCSALHDQEFYKNPHGTLRSVAEMPEPPIHPHCRCKLLPIIDPEVYFGDAVVKEGRRKEPEQHAILSEADVQDGVVIPLLGACGTGGRSELDGPAYGFFFGKNWTAGQNVTSWTPEKTKIEILNFGHAPADDLDKLGRQHDLGYIDCEIDCKNAHEEFFARYDCEFKGKMLIDEELVRGLEALPQDPTQWESNHAWTPERIAYAKKLRRFATWYFTGSAASARRMIEGEN
jgi:hypothetical protein